MSNQTLQRPKSKSSQKTAPKATQKPASKSSTQNVQQRRRPTASRASAIKRTPPRFDIRREGDPLIFGWGKHLTRVQKAHIQQLATYGFVGLVVLLIVGVLSFGWVRENYIIPNQTIVSVNGVNIPQDSYRKEMDYVSQTTWNVLENEILQQNAIASQVAAGNANAVNENNILTPEIQSEEANFSQSSLSSLAAANLIEDQLIVDGAHTFEREHHLPTSTFEPSDRAVQAGLGIFKRAFPKNEKYSDFLSKDHLTTNDIKNAIRMDLRRQLMQKYLASQLVSPTLQIDMRHIETNTLAQAQAINTQLKAKKYSDAEWKTLAAKDSLDTNTKAVGGDLGWIAPGSGDAAIEMWAFAPGRKVGDVTTMRDANGTFDVVQILQINPKRAVDPSTLANNKSNALSHWLSGQKTPGVNNIGTPNSSMLSDSRNLPTLPNLNATLPNESGQNGSGTSGATGLP